MGGTFNAVTSPQGGFAYLLQLYLIIVTVPVETIFICETRSSVQAAEHSAPCFHHIPCDLA